MSNEVFKTRVCEAPDQIKDFFGSSHANLLAVMHESRTICYKCTLSAIFDT